MMHFDPNTPADGLDVIVKIASALGAVAAAAGGGFFGWFKLRARANKPPAAGYELMWKRMDEMSTRADRQDQVIRELRDELSGLKSGVRDAFSDLADQWPHSHPPTLHEDTIDKLGDLLPSLFRRQA